MQTRKLLLGVLFGTALVAPSLAFADHDVRAKVRIGPGGKPHAVVRVDRAHRVPPGFRVRGPGRVTVRVNPFRARLGWHVNRFSPRERAAWQHGRWWHGRHRGRIGWWWWLNGSWFFYNAPVYPYPGYVSETYYDEAAEDYGNYWYYCRDPQGYYPYVRDCRGSWEPVPAQPSAGYGDSDDAYGDQGGPGEDEMGPDQGPPDDYGPDDQGPSDEDGPPDDGPPPR